MAEDAEEKPKKLHGCAYVFYYLILFFAVWFGAHHFDQDGDGDFEPDDIQHYLAENGWLGEKYRKSEREKAAARKRGAAAKKAKAEAEKKAKAEAEKRASEAAAGRGSMFDRDGDGDVDIDDFMNSAVEGEAQEDKAMADLMAGQVVPYFIIFECVAVFCLWFVMAIIRGGEDNVPVLEMKAGLDSLADGMTDLRLAGPGCEDYRTQAWRWLSYQFTHVGAAHVLMNVFLNVMLGIPLEGTHGGRRLAIMFNFGVFGGACCYFVSDAHVPVVGCSGGCYALIGIHMADLIMNWSQKRFRLPTIAMIVILVAVDVLTYTFSTDDGSMSHAAHVGGAVAGLIIGVLVVKNTHVKLHEKVVAAVMGVIGVAAIGGCLAWIFVQEGGPLNVLEAAAGEPGWCWTRQIWNATIDEFAWKCIRCGSAPCISQWGQERYIMEVSDDICKGRGWYYDGR